ncbi:MAG: DUF4129 domain-containing protein [Pedobacter sp.]|nr:DUF4129 domain-containing protein [Pedobacter sp.]
MTIQKNIEMRIALFLILFSFGLWPTMGTAAQDKAPKVRPKPVLRQDSSQVQVRKFEEDDIVAYRSQKEFIYDDVAPARPDLWERFWRWFWDTVGSLFKHSSIGTWGKFLVIGLVVAIIAFIVIKIVGVDLKVLMGKSKKVTVPYQESLENIHEIDFDEQLEMALGQHNYRLAVRLLYLKTLKKLSDHSAIHWQPEKTNQAYVRELQDQPYRDEFARLTQQFEYIWYGEFAIDQTAFEPINSSFLTFNQKMI